MKVDPFVQARSKDWKRFEEIVYTLQSRTFRRQKATDRKAADEFPRAYRRLTRDLALARERDFDPALIDRLNSLARSGHQLLHQDRTSLLGSIGRFIVRDFPRAVRRDKVEVAWAHLAFWGPFLFMLVMGQLRPEWITSVVGVSTERAIEEMYDPANRTPGSPDGESRFVMFGFYIFNNIGIGLKTFGLGILFGIGSILILVFNGTVIGALFAHALNLGFHSTFLPFVSGHGSFELTAICLSGAAGLKFGSALVNPGRRSRKRALVESGREAVTVLYGAVLFLVIAALIEGFWSPSGAPATYKYVVGGVNWALVAAYLLFCGRGDA